jgi:hypothetical protein
MHSLFQLFSFGVMNASNLKVFVLGVAVIFLTAFNTIAQVPDLPDQQLIYESDKYIIHGIETIDTYLILYVKSKSKNEFGFLALNNNGKVMDSLFIKSWPDIHYPLQFFRYRRALVYHPSILLENPSMFAYDRNKDKEQVFVQFQIGASGFEKPELNRIEQSEAAKVARSIPYFSNNLVWEEDRKKSQENYRLPKWKTTLPLPRLTEKSSFTAGHDALYLLNRSNFELYQIANNEVKTHKLPMSARSIRHLSYDYKNQRVVIAYQNTEGKHMLAAFTTQNGNLENLMELARSTYVAKVEGNTVYSIITPEGNSFYLFRKILN